MSLFCYNRGCQKNYTPTDDPSHDEIACQHHPGLPYFHDAYKIWSCCQKKSHDFSTFLAIPGCQHGPHQPNKPIEPTASRPVETKPVITEMVASAPKVQLVRPSIDAPLMSMKLIVASSLQAALDKLANAPLSNTSVNEPSSEDIKPGTPCRHAACGARYTTADEEQMSRCQYHPGVPIFHEGIRRQKTKPNLHSSPFLVKE
jgi:cysteine and histidine-rich domain-containing protein